MVNDAGLRALRVALPKLEPDDRDSDEYKSGFDAALSFFKQRVLHDGLDLCDCEDDPECSGSNHRPDCECIVHTDDELLELFDIREFWPFINGWVTADERDLTDDETEGAEAAQSQVAGAAGFARHH